jgi:hypothetical protein
VPRNLLAVLACLVALAGGLIVARPVALAATEPPATPQASTVRPIRLSIDYRDGVIKTFTSLAHQPGMTVFDALLAAGKHPRGVKIETRGSGETAFVVAIDDLKNQGGGAEARNWQFRVNGDLGKRGSGVTELAPGDEVLWVFEVYKAGK